jgi:tRNA threonylcarbamoyl adenosine modification protein YjeE
VGKNKPVTTKNEQETIKFAKNFLEKILQKANGGKPFGKAQGKPLIFCLQGELGAGKTHFVKGLAEGLGITDNITSPTFVLMKKYGRFFHIDCYRIYDAEDARQIGLDKIFKIPNAIIAIEWAERIKDIIPTPYWEIKMEHAEDSKRKISIKHVQR